MSSAMSSGLIQRNRFSVTPSSSASSPCPRKGTRTKPGGSRTREANAFKTDRDSRVVGDGDDSFPAWFNGALEKFGKDPREVEKTLTNARKESRNMSLGMGILWRDLRRGVPLAAKELLKETLPFYDCPELSLTEKKRAERARHDFWPSFWFGNLFMNTVPWTPLVLPVVLKLGEATKLYAKENVVPSQLDRVTEKRLDRLIKMRERREEEEEEEEEERGGAHLQEARQVEKLEEKC